MALIQCPECNNLVSSIAESCPHCGAPIAGARESHATGVQIKTIQETGKRLKLQILVSSAIFWVGLVWLIIEMSNTVNSGGEQPKIPVVILLIGTVWYIATRIRIWWHHK